MLCLWGQCFPPSSNASVQPDNGPPGDGNLTAHDGSAVSGKNNDRAGRNAAVLRRPALPCSIPTGENAVPASELLAKRGKRRTRSVYGGSAFHRPQIPAPSLTMVRQAVAFLRHTAEALFPARTDTTRRETPPYSAVRHCPVAFQQGNMLFPAKINYLTMFF
ncbi:hypothetical protein KSP39_PZI006660 [Platanthera zijinensis]|uniref:Uncharacterized protein n=1 Tax=Platanthera zijinensis TaxID=2320716 RepID=A0AAP0BP50_9ASPA